jgi:hypothetical protein
VDISHGSYGSALEHINAAIDIDSSRLDAWYAYLGLCQMREDPQAERRVSHKISSLLNQSHIEYVDYLGKNRFIGNSIYGLHGPDLDGNLVSFSQFEGKVIVFQTFNFWCTTPGKEFPTIKKLIGKHPQVQFVFLNAGETPAELRERYFTRPQTRFLRNQIIVFRDSSMSKFFQGSIGIGEILLIDKQGKVRYSFPGMAENFEAMINDKIHELLNEK